jgi:hypothetical protein
LPSRNVLPRSVFSSPFITTAHPGNFFPTFREIYSNDAQLTAPEIYSTIFSPEDGTPFLQRPPTGQEGRSRFYAAFFSRLVGSSRLHKFRLHAFPRVTQIRVYTEHSVQRGVLPANDRAVFCQGLI